MNTNKIKDNYAKTKGFVSWNHLLNCCIIFEMPKDLKDHLKSVKISEYEKIKGYSSNLFSKNDWVNFDIYLEYEFCKN